MASHMRLPSLLDAWENVVDLPDNNNVTSSDAHEGIIITTSKGESSSSSSSELMETKVVTTCVRTGQQVYAPGQHLVILGSVNSGAEVLADGNVHIYGKLRGRALAGITGSTRAKIFVQHFDAELVAIADKLLACDGIEDAFPGKLVRVSHDRMNECTSTLILKGTSRFSVLRRISGLNTTSSRSNPCPRSVVRSVVSNEII